VLQNKALNHYKSLVCTNVECGWRCCLKLVKEAFVSGSFDPQLVDTQLVVQE
jgi:hypothetical protein